MDENDFESLLNNYPPKKRDICEPKKTERIQRQVTLDLHGLTLNEAEIALTTAIREETRKGTTSIRTVTGKGLHSANGRAILKENIRKGLNSGRYGHIRSFCQGKAAEGGSGVFIIRLPDRGQD